MKTTIAVLLLLTAAPAVAQPAFDIAPTLECLDAQGDEGDGMQCIGLAAGACMEDDYSTPAMGFCLEQEWMWWDGQLNDAYGTAMSLAKRADADAPPPLNVQAGTLRDMQRAWIAFRDARCGWEAALWQGGTGAGPAQIACLMQETGRQAITLQILGAGQ